MRFFSVFVLMLLLTTIDPARADTQSSMTVLEFADGNTLFVADPDGGRIFAYTLTDRPAQVESKSYNLLGFGSAVARTLGVDSRTLRFHDIAVHPKTRNVWLSVSVQRDGGTESHLLTADQNGRISRVDLSQLGSTFTRLTDTASDGVSFWRDIPATTLAITDLDYVDGTLYVSGLSTGEFASTLRKVTYPFLQSESVSKIEIYHTVHNQTETRAPIRAMTVMNLNGEATVIAAYTCTPLVTIPVSQLDDGAHVRGKTVAELGYGNTPLDVISFTALDHEQRPEQYVLVVHKERSADLIRVSDLAAAAAKEGLSEPELWAKAGVRTRPLPLAGALAVADQDEQLLLTLKRNMTTGDVDLVSFRKGAYFRLSDFISEYNFPDYRYTPEQEFYRTFQNLLKADAGFPDLAR